MTRREHDLTCVIVLDRLRGYKPASIAWSYGVSLERVNKALEHGITYIWPGGGPRNRVELFLLPETARVRLGLSWRACYLTRCVLVMSAASPNPHVRIMGRRSLAAAALILSHNLTIALRSPSYMSPWAEFCNARMDLGSTAR
jgi:hypothetical protein